MDQPYSRIADSLMDYQYWSPNDPQRTPYDDTGWTFPELYNVQAVRVTDAKVLDAAMEKVTGEVRPKGEVVNSTAGSVFVVNHNADIALVTLRYKFKDASFEAAEEAVRRRRQEVQPRLVHHQECCRGRHAEGRRRSGPAGRRGGQRAVGEDTPAARAARRAAAHLADDADRRAGGARRSTTPQVPYTYISTQDVATRVEPECELRRDRLSAGRPRA